MIAYKCNVLKKGRRCKGCYHAKYHTAGADGRCFIAHTCLDGRGKMPITVKCLDHEVPTR